MKKLFYVSFFLLFAGCSSDTGWDCIQTSGNIVQREINLPAFSKILVMERAKLFIKQGEVQKVVVESGENLMRDIKLTVTDGRLEIRNNNSCNLFRDYGLTKVYVTTPNISEIRSSTGLTIESSGLLRFPNLNLISEDFAAEDQFHVDGDFRLNLEVENLNVTANGISKFYLSGSATSASMGLYSGDCRIYSKELVVQDLNIYHRSTGPMEVNPQQSIRGTILSLGNVISINRPPIVAVEELYRGRLIFE